MQVGVVGSGPGAEAVTAALADADAAAASVDPDDVGRVPFAVVVADAGDRAFERANAAALDGETPWLAVERGGVGGARGLVEAAVAGFAPGGACYECLRARVAANLDEDGDGGGAGGADAATARFAGALAGREAARLLSGGESTLLGGVVEVPHAERRVLPVPGCVCDDGGSRSLDRTYRERSLDDALARAEQALDPRVGLVREVGESESFPTPYYLATLCDTTGFSDAAAARHAAGVSADWDEAFVKALGEGLERYAAGVYRATDLPRGPADAIENAVPPERFVGAPWLDGSDAEESPAWVPGEHLATGEAVHLPAEFVLFPPPAVRTRPAITTGLGLGNSGAEALAAGLSEVVERDAAMLAWYSTYEPLGLAVDDEGYRTLAHRARAEDLTATALLLTQDVDVPVVAACVHREGDWPRFAAGMAADLDPAAAARSALAEALQNWMELRGMGRERAEDEEGAVGEYAAFPPPVREFVSPKTEVPAASVGREAPTGEGTLPALVERVADAGLDAYAASLTPRDVASLGFAAVRVVVPAAQPLFGGSPYFGERAERVPAELGFEPRPEREHHPFP